MDVEFFAIADCFRIEHSHIHRLDNKYVVAECKERNIVIAQSGVGKVNAEECAKAIYMQYPQISGYISAGLAGALSVQLNIGDIVVGNAIIVKNQDKWEKIRIMDQVVQNAIRQNAQRGLILCCDEFINNAVKKQNLNTESGAVCVEMESGGMARFAYANRIPFAAIKIISDSADEKALRSIIRMYKTACDKLAFYLNDIVDTVFTSSDHLGDEQ